jgi:hypothetical protein
MAQAVSHQPLTAETWVHVWSVHVGFLVDRVALGQGSAVSILQWLSILMYHLGAEQ